MKYQIRKCDEFNWQLFRWQDGGEVISRGRYAGQLTTARWCPMENYHGRLEHAAVALLQLATRENMPQETGDANAILEALEAAKREVLEAVAAVTPEAFQQKSKRGRKAKEDSSES